MLTTAVIGFSRFSSGFIVPLCLLAALAHGWRVSRGGVQHCWRIPLLWSLHFSYLFLPVGLLVLALNRLGYWDDFSTALHCFTVGVIGSMILAMISRVTLGHTGRPLKAPKWIALAFVLILFSAVVRVIVPAWLPQWSQAGILVASIAWILAYGIFILQYGPMLLSARVDGRHG